MQFGYCWPKVVWEANDPDWPMVDQCLHIDDDRCNTLMILRLGRLSLRRIRKDGKVPLDTLVTWKEFAVDYFNVLLQSITVRHTGEIHKSVLLNSLKMHAGLTRFPMLSSTMADTEGTRCDIENFSCRVNTADSIDRSMMSGKNY
jgi:hypothetical protein